MDANALADRLSRNATATLELYAVYLGERLGLYRALAGEEAVTSSELAARTGVAERYVREWLEHQAVTELVEVDDPRAETLARRTGCRPSTLRYSPTRTTCATPPR